MGKTAFFAYLRHGDDVLTAVRTDEILFPSFIPEDGNLAQVHQVIAFLRQAFDAETFVRRPLLSDFSDDVLLVVHEVAFVEPLAARPEPREGFAWLPVKAFAHSLTREAEKALAKQAFEAEADPRDTASARESFGFLTVADFVRKREEVTRAVCEGTGRTPTRVEQFRHWDRSTLFRCEFNGGVEPVFAKYVPSFLATEALVASWMASRFPLNAIQVRANLGDGRGYIMDALPPDRLERRSDVGSWQRALALHATIQRCARDDIASGVLRGVPVRDMDWLHDTLRELFAIKDVGSLGLHNDEEAAFRAAVPKLWKVMDELDATKLPVSLVHGDLWPGNVALDGERLVIFDWSDACVAPAFLDLANFLMDLEGELGTEGARALPSLVGAYAAEWADVFPPERMLNSFGSLRALAHAHSAAFYWAVVLPHITHPWQLRNMLPHALAKMIEALDVVQPDSD